MKPQTARILRALFFVYVGVTFLHIAYVVNHEPFAFDAWNVAVDTHSKPASIGNFFSFWHQQYTSSNPRIGQPLAYLAYKTTGFGEIGTALAYLAIVLAGFVIGTRRFPKLSENRDLATLSIGIGFLWFVSPNFPAYMFCRAYATNYVWLAAFQLWFLVPLRLLDLDARVSLPKLAGYFLLGVVAGMGNEHVGPTLIVFTLAFGAWLWRTKHAKPVLVWVGAAGLLVGYALIFFAPGQNQRYEGLGERYTLIQQILVRGVRGNIDIFLDMLEAAAPMMMLLTCIVGVGLLTERDATKETRDRQIDAFRIVVLAVMAGSLITITVFASPKLGPRFYIHSMMILLAALLGVISAFLRSPRALAPFVVISVLASGYAAARTIPMYTRLSNDSDQRIADLEKTPRGGDYTSTAWEQVPEMWWFLGDDMRDQKKQELVAKYFDLHRVLFRGGDQWKTLGVTDAKLTMHYEFETPMCMDEIDQLDLKQWVGRDIAALHHAFLDAIVEIQRFGKLRSIDLRATFLGTHPPLPSPNVFIAKWRDGVLDGHVARLRRVGRSKQREVVLPPELKAAPWDIYMVLVGDPPKKLGVSTQAQPLAYIPWGTGQYWALACRQNECYVVLAVAHSI